MAEKPKKDMSKGRISIVIVGMIVAAITMILIGIWLSKELYSIFDEGSGYDYTIVLFACFCLVFATYAIINKYLTEGMFFVITSLVAFICVIMKFFTGDLLDSMFYMMVAYIVCAVIFHIRKEHVFEIGSILAAISLLCIYVTGMSNHEFFILFSLAGLLVLVSGCFSLADIGPEWMRARNITVHKVSSMSYAYTVTYSAGTFLSCLVFFSIGLDKGSDGLLTFKILVSALTIITGVYGICNGCHKRGIDLVILSAYAIICAVSDMYGMGVIPSLNVVLAIPLATSAYMDYKDGAPVKMVCSMLFAAVMVSDAFFASTMFFQVLVFVTKIVTLYDSISTWFIFETGWAPKFMRYNKGRVTFDD